MLLSREMARRLLPSGWMFLSLAGVALAAGLIFGMRDHLLIGTAGVGLALVAFVFGRILLIRQVRFAVEESSVYRGR
jgi:hypothetical protein